MEKGVLTRWYDDKGYGFIRPSKGGERVFVHITAFRSLRGRPKLNMKLAYQQSQDASGKVCATQARSTSGSNSRLRAAPIGFTAALLMMLPLLVYQQSRITAAIVACYAIMSCLLFILYGIDKNRARRNGRRVPEAHLQLLALAGGWPGALFAQQVFRHKTRKRAFLLVFWLAVLTNVSIVVVIGSQATLH